jgi:hypothetical protein
LFADPDPAILITSGHCAMRATIVAASPAYAGRAVEAGTIREHGAAVSAPRSDVTPIAKVA